MQIQPFLYVIYGAMWIVWLTSLRMPTAEQCARDASLESQKCAHVRPLLATFLYILAWTFLISISFSLLCVPWINCNDPRMSKVCSTAGILFMAVLILIFAMQVKYIDGIRNSSLTVKENCSQPERRYQRGVVYAFAIYIFIVGMGGILLMSAVFDSKDDLLSIIKNSSQPQALVK